MKNNIRKLHESFRNAWRGLVLCARAERNFRVHLVAAFYVTVFAIIGQASAADGAMLSICFGLTMGAELMNTAIERLCDKQASGYDQIVRDAKDIAAGGVFVCAVACAVVGILLFLRHGILLRAIAFLTVNAWMIVLLLFAAIISLGFIFKYGRIQ